MKQHKKISRTLIITIATFIMVMIAGAGVASAVIVSSNTNSCHSAGTANYCE